MGTDDVFTRKDKKLGTGIDDDLYLEHDGADSHIVNNTGDFYINCTTAGKKTFIGNGTNNNQIVIDHDNDHIGFGLATPLYALHLKPASGLSQIVVENSTSQLVLSAVSTSVYVGSFNNYPLQLITNGTAKATISITGGFYNPAGYSIGIGTPNIDLYMDSTGLIGPLPSCKIYKNNIRDLTSQDTEWIYQVPVKICDYINGSPNQITVIAEDAEKIRPDVIRYTPFEITENGPIMINRAEFKNLEKIINLILPGEEKEIELDKIILDANGDEATEKITKRVKLQPFTTNKSDFIYPMLKEMQKMKLTINNLAARIIELEK